ncbi:MAG TPA: TetR/AcrR family transcriptional regulator [Sphingomonas sp.]
MSDGMALARLMPDSLAEEEGGAEPECWQRRKSRATRNAMLDSALECLAVCGYAGCSLQTVASRAGISRGAMLHHYASKLDLMAAVIEYAFYRRMADYLDRIRALSEEARAVDNAGIAISYRVCRTPEYAAYLELHIASRTDRDLRAIFLDRARRFDRVWRGEIERAFPEWSGDPRLELLDDYVWSVVEGLALNIDIWDDPAREEALLAFVARTIRAVRVGAIPVGE